MNLNLSFWKAKKTLFTIAGLVIVVSIISVIWRKSVEPLKFSGKLLQSEKLSEELRELKNIEISPDRLKSISRYKLTFNKSLFKDYYNYLESQNIIVLDDIKTKHEKYLFIGNERTGDPHWLGNDYVFFTTKCGTDCQGLYLLDTRDQETKLGVLSYMSDREFWETVFKDWFDQKFRFPGLMKEIKSETVDGKSYLVFWMIDGDGVSLGEKRFLFTGEALVEQ